jgi:hypothetical protein
LKAFEISIHLPVTGKSRGKMQVAFVKPYPLALRFELGDLILELFDIYQHIVPRRKLDRALSRREERRVTLGGSECSAEFVRFDT